MFTDEGWALLSEETRRSIIGVLDQDREEKTRLLERRQSRSRKDRRKDPRPDKQTHPSKSLDRNTCQGMFGIQITFCGSDSIVCSTIQTLRCRRCAILPANSLGTDALIILILCYNSLMFLSSFTGMP